MATTVQSYGSVLEFLVRGQAEGQAINHVEHWVVGTDAGSGIQRFNDLTTLHDALWNSYQTNILPVQPDTFSTISSELLCIGSVGDPTISPPDPQFYLGIDIQGRAFDGGVLTAGDVLPTHDAISIRKLANKPGRRFRGGWRLFGLLEGETSNNLIDTVKQLAVASAVTTHYTFGLADYGSGIQEELYPVVYSLKEATSIGGTDAPGFDASARITGVIVSQYVSSQVSRKQRQKLG